jgi:hypothetical protein
MNGLSLIIIPRRVFSQRSEPALKTCIEDFDLKENSVQSWVAVRGGRVRSLYDAVKRECQNGSTWITFPL